MDAAAVASGKPRWRRYLRRAGLGLLIALGVIVLLLVIVGFALETEGAREVARDKMEAQLGQVFAGDVSVGEIASNPLRRIEVRDLVIDGPDGQPAIKLDRLLVEFSLAGALDKTIRIQNVALEGLELWARVDDQGQWNLAQLVRPSEDSEPTEPPGEPSAWEVVVEQVAIEGRVHAPDNAEYPLTLSLATTNAGANAISLEAFALALGEVRIDVAPTRFEPPTGALETSFELAVVRDTLASFLGELPGPEGVRLALSARRGSATKPFEIEANVETSDGQSLAADVALSPETPSVRGTVAARGVDIEVLTGADVPSKIDADLELDIAGADPRELVGSVALTASGRLLAEPVKEAEIRVAADKGAFDVKLIARYAGVAADLKSAVRLEGDDYAKDVVVDDLKATFVAANLARAVDGRAPVSGRVKLNVEAKGTPASVEGRVTLQGRNVVAGDMRIGDVFVSAEAKQAGDRTRLSSLEVKAAGASLRANANLDGDAVEARLGRLEVAVADVARLIGFKGRAGGTVIVRGDVAMAPGKAPRGDVRLETKNVRWGPTVASLDSTTTAKLRPGRLGIALDATDSKQPLGNLSLRVDARTPADALDGGAWARQRERLLRSLDLDWRGARIDAATLKRFGVAVEASAGVEAQIDIADRGSRIDVAFAVDDATSEFLAAATGATFKLSLVDGRVETALESRTDGVGTVDLRARARAPRRWTDGAAWSMAGPGWLEEAALDVAVDLPGLQPFGVPKDVAGRATVNVDVAAGVETVTGAVSAEATSGEYGGPFAATVNLTAQPAATVAKLGFAIEGKTFATAQVRGEVGTKAALAGNTDAFLSAALQGELTTGELRIERLLAIAKQQNIDATGVLDLTVSVAGTASDPKVEARLRTRDVRAESVAVPALDIDARASKKELEATVAATGLDLAMNAQLSQTPFPISASLKADEFALGILAPVVPGLEGRLSGDVEVSGTSAAPMASGELRVDGLGLAPVGPIGALSRGTVLVAVEQRFEGQGGGGTGDLVTQLDLTADTKAGDGEIEVRANGVLDGRGLRMARASLETDDLELRNSVKAKLGTDVELAVDRDPKGVLRGRVDVGDTLLRIEQSSTDARDLYETGTLEDVVILGPNGRVLGPDGEPIDPGEIDSARQESRGPPRVVVDIRAPRTIQVAAPEGRLVLDADLKARAVPGFALEGTVLSDEGRLELFGRNYRLDRFLIGFAGDPAVPSIDIGLSHDFPRFTMSIALSGTPDDPELVLSSEPSIYDEHELLSFLLGAEPGADEDSGGTPAEQARAAAAGVLAAQLQSAVKERLPIDVLRLELSEDGASAAKVTVGKWITRRLFVAVRPNFAAEGTENNAEARIEYRLLRNLLLEGYFGDQSAAGVDLFWIKRF